MKINYATATVTLYLGFVAMIIVLVTMSMSQKVDLVTDKYYDEELRFQEKIDKRDRSAALPQQISWNVTGQGISIIYPETMADSTLSGKIRLYCPADENQDLTVQINAKDHTQLIPASTIKDGSYKLQIDWKSGGLTYWDEGIISIRH
ncbi:FixH family protein [Dyadobacter crusticola]|uniref:FixH family protein n=1 Tax=Dyadobacter crusticola TaxID=292407 RepID=UPI0004E28417|nr:FixH family protein [Dyadobacter crusticola]